MELHARGLERAGHRATTFFSEDIDARANRAIPRRAPGARAYSALYQRYLDEQPDVLNVHTQAAPAWILARMSKRVTASVVVMSYAADETAVRLERPWDALRWLRSAVPARLTFPRADGIWCVNQQDLEFYRTRYFVARERLRLFPHAVGDVFYDSPSRVERNMRQILFVGSWILRKGTDVLVAALERVVARVPEVSIVLAGTLLGESALRPSLSARLNARVRIVERADDEELVQLYRSSGFLAVPSRREGLPIGMLEAMACGCPPLAAANSGMLDVIVSGENGWLEASFEPDRWAERIERLLETPAEVARASQGAAQMAERFRIDVVARDVAHWYESLVTHASSHWARRR
jgi:glycosyltransferase involved in cell wall biosynthesis